jgi:hypothetical protein
MNRIISEFDRIVSLKTRFEVQNTEGGIYLAISRQLSAFSNELSVLELKQIEKLRPKAEC